MDFHENKGFVQRNRLKEILRRIVCKDSSRHWMLEEAVQLIILSSEERLFTSSLKMLSAVVPCMTETDH